MTTVPPPRLVHTAPRPNARDPTQLLESNAEIMEVPKKVLFAGNDNSQLENNCPGTRILTKESNSSIEIVLDDNGSHQNKENTSTQVQTTAKKHHRSKSDGGALGVAVSRSDQSNLPVTPPRLGSVKKGKSSNTTAEKNAFMTPTKNNKNATPRKCKTVTPGKAKSKLLSSSKKRFLAPLSAGRPSKREKLTPPRSAGIGSRVSASKNLESKLMSSSTGFDDANEFMLRSSELEPSLFQIELPSREDVLTHGKICSLMDDYTASDREFDFSTLEGVARSQLEDMCKATPDGDDNTLNALSYRPIIQAFLKCSDDLTVEGFFREYTEDSERVEVCVFFSQRARQFIVCYRGSTSTQSKPIRNRDIKQTYLKDCANKLDDKHKVPVLPTFRDAYYTKNLEESVFSLLNRLVLANPFCDVVMTGHSFGGALATIAAMKYADSCPMIRVSCHAYGSPRVGGLEFRQLVHSLPNLKVVRLENGSDPYVCMPEGSSWFHVGHTITLNAAASSSFPSVGGLMESGNNASSDSNTVDLLAYRFDKERPSANFIVNGMSALSRMGHHGKGDHDIKAYVMALERTILMGTPWVDRFVGMVGDGVVSKMDNEQRLVV